MTFTEMQRLTEKQIEILQALLDDGMTKPDILKEIGKRHGRFSGIYAETEKALKAMEITRFKDDEQ